eukprot:CAMPEP_0206226714 /NCGR_PEP_ID=MMETSP0047_2-20121206/8241_1 /ASSEMBLY_ACC=CAM_ASM_000192 /TAXON_ID=195065 /ORGANISM="Chroomonas mesostigmatica_cf, Strain CCMP1168" /LENGTH=459 /DNA_ID=CAMNT_0053649825 /DNA_START=115 /DNA_END=1491 /DNA_ORIENTATION=-
MKASSIVSLACAVALVGLVPAAGEESNGFVLLPPSEMAEQDAIREHCQGGGSDWFSVGAMFVAFREALEACVIVSVMLNILSKTRMPHFTKFVWLGVGLGTAVSCIVGAGVVTAYFMAQGALLEYKDKAAFSGTFSLIAALFLSALAIQFLRFKDIEVKYKRKLAESVKKVTEREAEEAVEGGEALEGTDAILPAAPNTMAAPSKTSVRAMLNDPDLKGTAWSIFALCFTAVLREMLECFIFLAAFAGEHTQPAAIAIGAIVGIILGGLFGYMFLIMGKCLKDMRWFLLVVTVFMLFISAGLFALSANAFKTVALIDMGLVDTDLWVTTPLYDIYKSTGDGHQLCGFFAVIRAIFGYTHNPSFVWWFTYLLYWAISLGILGWRTCRGTLFSKDGLRPFELDDEDEGSADGDVESGVAVDAKRVASSSASSDLVHYIDGGHPRSHFPRMPVPPGFHPPPP